MRSTSYKPGDVVTASTGADIPQSTAVISLPAVTATPTGTVYKLTVLYYFNTAYMSVLICS